MNAPRSIAPYSMGLLPNRAPHLILRMLRNVRYGRTPFLSKAVLHTGLLGCRRVCACGFSFAGKKYKKMVGQFRDIGALQADDWCFELVEG